MRRRGHRSRPARPRACASSVASSGSLEARARIRLGSVAEAKPSAASTSSGPRTSVAPSRMRALQPAALGRSTSPGYASTSMPSDAAQLAVLSAPLRAAASTTTTASAKAAITPLRCKKWAGRAGSSGAYGERTAPPAASDALRQRSIAPRKETGDARRRVSRAVGPPPASAPAWAAASMPSARPDMTHMPARASARAEAHERARGRLRKVSATRRRRRCAPSGRRAIRQPTGPKTGSSCPPRDGAREESCVRGEARRVEIHQSFRRDARGTRQGFTRKLRGNRPRPQNGRRDCATATPR